MNKTTLRAALVVSALTLTSPHAIADEVVASGPFYGATGHRAAGNARITKQGGGYTLGFTGFASDPGPDIYVILSTARQPRTSQDIKGARYIVLGRIRARSGAQSYALPAGVDPGKYHSVGIWCRQYSILFGAAALAGK